MPPRFAIPPFSSLLRQSHQQCAASRFSPSAGENAIRALSTITMRNAGDILLRRPGFAMLAYRPHASSSRRVSSKSDAGGKGKGEGEGEGEEGEGRGRGEEVVERQQSGSELSSVSEEAAETAKIMERRTECGEVGGPELLQGSMVGEILKRDKEALKNAPKVLRDQLAGSSSSSSSSSSPSGSRSFSTSARLRQFTMQEMPSAAENDASSAVVRSMINPATEEKFEQVKREGLKFDVPETLPRSDHLKHRYDPLLDQFTKMLMRHGKLSVAQKHMDAILHHLRSSPAPILDPSLPLLPGPPASHFPLNPILYLTLVIDSVSPLLRIKQQPGAAGGGRSLPIPIPLALRQRRRTAIKWILDASEKRRDAALATRVAQEIIAVAEGKSSAWEKRAIVHKQATAARANIKTLGMKRRSFR
ncbi:hypothetical protein GX48_03715 [Paracoccidioides brasiliensis]|nr:hypothetical protein GX48_03715 [Paracoccidioides brasiliensis]